MKYFFLILLAYVCFGQLSGQGVLISPDNGNPDEDALLELRSTSQGFLPPRLDRAQRDIILNPPNGLVIYNTSTSRLNVFDTVANEWVELGPAPEADPAVTPTQSITLSSGHFHARESNDVYISAVGQGGANITTGVGGLVAPFHLPVGSRITGITFYYRDRTSAAEMSLSLTQEFLGSGFFNTVANFTTGVVNASPDWTNSGPVNVDHVVSGSAGYTLVAYSTSWSGDLHIKGAVISYTLPTN
ncbi:hypothetical protein [Neolewinella persica]|uniref:hypothetical protein n=1 Tax=Neolewinella persica TaxID=70998 RepID=UPI0012F8998D|nr:hypothetical protein [Neolewinella persica]